VLVADRAAEEPLLQLVQAIASAPTSAVDAALLFTIESCPLSCVLAIAASCRSAVMRCDGPSAA